MKLRGADAFGVAPRIDPPSVRPLITVKRIQRMNTGVTRYRAKTAMPVNPSRLFRTITAARMSPISRM